LKVLIELPTWLGDTVMSTPAIENIIDHYENAEIVLLGNESSLDIFKENPRITRVEILKKRIRELAKIPRKIGKCDIFFSFRGSFRSRLLCYFLDVSQTFQYQKRNFNYGHQVEKYCQFVNQSINRKYKPGNLIVFHSQDKFSGKLRLGINPGASYGSAKRWTISGFSRVAIELSKYYEIIIFGSKEEQKIANEIENTLKSRNINNFSNLAGKTTIPQLITEISKLTVFVTSDSGPMHIAAALGIPSVSIFGPTRDYETSQWKNKKSIILKSNLDCQPCMKRTCPLGHNLCMKNISKDDVINSINLISANKIKCI